MTIEERKPLLQTSALPEIERVELDPLALIPEEMLTTGDLGRKGKEKDLAENRRYVFVNGTADDFARWKTELEKRAADRPKFINLRCSKCGYRTRLAYREELKKGPVPCLYCNRNLDKKGGFLKEMSKGEIDEWERDKAADNISRSEHNRRMKEARKVAAMVDYAKQDRR